MVSALAALPDGHALSGSYDGTLRLWELQSGESRVLTGHTGKVTALAAVSGQKGRAAGAARWHRGFPWRRRRDPLGTCRRPFPIWIFCRATA